MAGNQNPTNPNYIPGVGRLVTDRFDFQKHVNGSDFRHNATQIDLSPNVVINSQTITTVQQAIQALTNILVVPTVNQATVGTATANLGTVTLGGDFAGTGSTALSPRVGGIQGRPIQNIAPGANQVLGWNGSAWTPVNAPPPTGPASGDLTGTYPSPTIAAGVIVDSYVNAAAAIAGTKISPNFGSQSVIATDFTSTAANTATVGTIRDAHNTTLIAVRDLFNAANVSVLSTDNNGAPILGNTTSTHTNILAKNDLVVQMDTGNVLTVANGFGPTLMEIWAALVLHPKVISTTDSPYTIDTGAMDTVILANCSTGSIIINLPDPYVSNTAPGRFILVIDYTGSSGTHTIAVNGYAGGNVNNSIQKQLVSNYSMMMCVSNGSSWNAALLSPPP